MPPIQQHRHKFNPQGLVTSPTLATKAGRFRNVDHFSIFRWEQCNPIIHDLHHVGRHTKTRQRLICGDSFKLVGQQQRANSPFGLG